MVVHFIEESNRARTPEELAGIYLDALDKFGFNRFIYSVLPDNLFHSHSQPFIGVLGNYPTEWVEHYVKNNYFKDDPVYKLPLDIQKPFAWSDIETGQFTPRQKKVMDERREAGIKNGYSLLVYGPLGAISAISVANDGAEITTDKNFISRLNATMNQFVLRFGELVKNTYSGTSVTLTEREKEVLLWCMQGKSNSVIAEILNVSKKTIEFHFASIFRKLQVNTRILAVLKAISLRLISP